MMSFNDLIHTYKLKKEATSNIKTRQILSSLSSKDVGIFLRDGPFETDRGIIILHPFQGTHWVLYIHECYFDSYRRSLPQKISKLIMKRNRHCFYSEYIRQGLTNKRGSYCAS